MDYKHEELNDLMDVSGLTLSSIKQLTSFLDGYAKEKAMSSLNVVNRTGPRLLSVK